MASLTIQGPVLVGASVVTVTFTGPTEAELYLFVNQIFKGVFTHVSGQQFSLTISQVLLKGDVLVAKWRKPDETWQTTNDMIVVHPADTSAYAQLFAQTGLDEALTDADVEIEAWSSRVLEKMLDYNQLPRFIEQTEALREFFKAVALASSWLVIRARKVSMLEQQAKLFGELLRQRGYLLTGYEHVTDLQAIAKELPVSFFKRGTRVTLKEEANNHLNANQALLSLVPREERGWVLGKTSPLYRGLAERSDLGKLVTLADVTLFQGQYQAEKLVLQATGGFQYQQATSFDIDTRVDYQLLVDVEATSSGELQLGVRGYTAANYQGKLLTGQGFAGDVFTAKKFFKGTTRLRVLFSSTSGLLQHEDNILGLTEPLATIKLLLFTGQAVKITKIALLPAFTPASNTIIQPPQLAQLWIDEGREPVVVTNLERKLLNYHYKVLHFGFGEGARPVDPCLDDNLPNWQPTGRGECRGTELYQEEEDVNPCSLQGTRWTLVTGDTSAACPECWPNGLYSHTLVDKTSCQFPFFYNGQKYRVKEKLMVHDGACGVRVASVTYKQPCVVDPCFDRDLIADWQVVASAGICLPSDIEISTNPTWQEDGPLQCVLVDDVPLTSQWAMVGVSCIRPTVVVDQDREHWQLLGSTCVKMVTGESLGWRLLTSFCVADGPVCVHPQTEVLTLYTDYID